MVAGDSVSGDSVKDVDSRQQALEQWAEQELGQVVSGVPASSDASFRRYFRYALNGQDGKPEHTLIAMDAPPPQEDCAPFVDIAHRLASAGLNVPDIVAQDLERGFLILSDLGTETYLSVINDANADTLFADAIQALVAMQANTTTAGLPSYDEALLRRELDLFPEWYLQHHLGVEINDELQARLDSCFDCLITEILKQTQVFVHRDFMPRNLMVSEPSPGVLDFQDAVLGPISYDAICLFKDAFLSWPEQKIEQWLQQYWQQAQQRQLAVPSSFENFQRDCDLMGVHRHLKVIGIFARICHRDGKSEYLSDVPRFFEYLKPVLARRPVLGELKALLEELQVLPV